MRSASDSSSALAGVRVVEISGVGNYCGKLFGDMGADVILVEPPGGGRARQAGPFIHGAVGDPEGSLSFAYNNTSKRSVVLDLETPEGQQRLRDLARTADLLLESEKPGTLARRGLGFESLSELNPRLVVTSITPFGQTGPWAQYEATDLVVLALGGLLYLGGYADGPPTQVAGEQAISAAAGFAGVASMLALLEAEKTGHGQHVDVSMQECVVLALENCAQFYDLEGVIRKRPASHHPVAGTGVFECQDGSVYLLAHGLGAGDFFWKRTLRWFTEAGATGLEDLEGERWLDKSFLSTDAAKDTFVSVFASFADQQTKAQLFRDGQRHGVPIAPLNAPAELLESPQLRARSYFETVPHPLLADPLVVPGSPYKLSATPAAPASRAPTLGEHTDDIIDGVQASQRLVAASPATPASREGLPLDGVRVIDFCWVGAGSLTTKLLADFGADVIKIESSIHVDLLRTSPPFKDGIRGVDRSGYFADRNSSKRSVTINMKDPEGREVAARLIENADVVTNNFRPGTMDGFGLGYDAVAALNPEAVYAAMSMAGAEGPERDSVGFGVNITAYAGLHLLSGQPDRPPAGTGTHYPDHIPNPCHAAFAILAAIRHQKRTGEGQYIDVAQIEPMVSMFGPAVLDEVVNRRPLTRTGNDHPDMVPHGVYPTEGADRWIAIAVADDAQWLGLLEALGSPAWAKRPEWRDASHRRADRRVIDDLLTDATSSEDGAALMAKLQAHGVACGIVQTVEDLVSRDPQLAHRKHWVRLHHREMGSTIYNAPPFRMSRTSVHLRSPAPLLGEHTHAVCGELLHLDRAHVQQLIDRQVLV